jgi:hypothetical protein
MITRTFRLEKPVSQVIDRIKEGYSEEIARIEEALIKDDHYSLNFGSLVDVSDTKGKTRAA